MRPVVLAVAITGSVPRKADNRRCRSPSPNRWVDAGSIRGRRVARPHSRVRNPDETPSSDPQLFKAVMEGVRRHCPRMIVHSRQAAADPNARGTGAVR
jgi:3-keto-5-aminohexanoate cleavage enzyme